MVRKIEIVSLSRGILGETFVRHELELGLKRLEEMGVKVVFSPNALMGLDYISAHPEARADDLISAFQDDSVDMILCAIGGDDTYRLLPYLFSDHQLERAVKDKIFLGYSDTTMNHLMLHKAGVKTFYGQAFLSDVCELSPSMLPYTEKYFRELLKTGRIKEVRPADVWYDPRTDFSISALGSTMPSHPAEGLVPIQGKSVFSGKILGGCIDTLYDIFDGTRYDESPSLCARYNLFPSVDEWKGRILLLETSEEKATPEKFERMVRALKQTGIFPVLSGVLMGRSIDGEYENEYRRIITEVIDDPSLPIVAGLSVGHSTPRCIIPFGVMAEVNADEGVIRFRYE